MPILAIDAGTSAVKAAVLDRPTGEPLARPVKVDYPIDRPTPDAAEVRPAEFWKAVSEAAAMAVAMAPADAPPVDGVGLSVLTPALFLLDESDEPIAPARIHLDRRSRPIARRAQAEVGDEFLATAGNRPLPGGLSALSFAHLIEEQPDLRPRIRHYLHGNGWLALKLTGERRCDPANASFTGLFNTVTDRRWSARWCDYFGVDMGWLPPVACGSATVGGLRQQVADAWKLPAGLPVKLGTADTSSAVLAAGLGPDDLLHSVGTTQVLARRTDHPTPDRRRLTRMFGVGDGYVYVAHNPVGGVALEWLHGLCFRDVPADEFFAKLIPAAADRATDVVLDPPFLGGDRLEVEPRAAGFAGLTLAADRDDLLAAVLDAMRRGHRDALAAVGWTDATPGKVVLTGGGADAVRHVLPGYADVPEIDEAALRGVARLFDAG